MFFDIDQAHKLLYCREHLAYTSEVKIVFYLFLKKPDELIS